MGILRTPAERFSRLPDFEFAPHFLDFDVVRIARVDEGSGPPILMLHGELTWSFLFRKCIPPLVAAGYRCIAADLPGFGRSDKPIDVGWYSFERHVDAIATLLRVLDLHDVTLVLHDWGGPIGMQIATGETGDRIARIVAVDTWPLTGDYDPGEVWLAFRDTIVKRKPVPCGKLVRIGCWTAPSRDIVDGYDAPFPDHTYQSGVCAFPQLVPLAPSEPVARSARACVDALARDERPALLMWGESDPIFPREQFAARLQSTFANAPEPRVIPNAGHFVFEDQGAQIAATITRWLMSQQATSKK